MPQDQVKLPIPSDGSQEPLVSDKDIPVDEEDQHGCEIRPARVSREEWLEDKTDQYERDDEHQEAPAPFSQPRERGNESFSGISIQPDKDRQSYQRESEQEATNHRWKTVLAKYAIRSGISWSAR